MFSSAANCGVLASVLPLWLWECGAEPPCSVVAAGLHLCRAVVCGSVSLA